MGRHGKWVHAASPEQPLAEVARLALGDRLRQLWRYLRRAAEGALADTENVHQLRVSTRRCVAAIELFDSLLSRRRKKWIRKQLKAIRRAAADARDLDVLLERLGTAAPGNEDVAGDLTEFLKRARRNAQAPIDRIFMKLKRKRFARKARKLVERVRFRTAEDLDAQPTYRQAAVQALAPRLRSFFLASRGNFGDEAALHAFRIEGKHLRYAMEIFATALPPAFRDELYPMIATLQERLGKINDHATAIALFTHWLGEVGMVRLPRQTFERLIEEERRELAAAKAEFLAWWNDDCRCRLSTRFAEVLEVDASTFDGTTEDLSATAPPTEGTIALRRAE